MIRTMRPTLGVIPNRGSQLMDALPINTATQEEAVELHSRPAWTAQWDYLKGGQRGKEKRSLEEDGCVAV